MGTLHTYASEFMEAAARLGGLGAEVLGDRLELAALELREAKIRFLQVLILALAGTALCLLGLTLALITVILVLPEHLRLAALAAAAALCLLAGAVNLFRLKRRLSAQPPPFSQSLAELQKDRECF